MIDVLASIGLMILFVIIFASVFCLLIIVSQALAMTIAWVVLKFVEFLELWHGR